MRTILSRTHNNQAGQALPLFGIMVFVLLGFVAMSIDVGRYVWARTSMQAGVDAAAIAAAQDMPILSDAEATAASYWVDNSSFIQSQGENVSFAVSYPPGNKRIRVSAEADIPTWFARLFGVDHWTVSAEGDAEAQVLDIAVVLDVSGSMCYDAPGTLTTESQENTLMSPGHPAGGVPTITTAVSGSTGSSIVITLSSNAIFNSTSSSTNNTNFGYSSTSRYHQRTIAGRQGIIAIFANGSSGPYELFKITAVGPGANQLTVTRAQTNNWTGAATPQMAHSVGAEVWANRVGCDKAARSATAPYGLDPFDGTIANAEYFTTMFNASYDKIALAKYATTASSVQSLTSSLTGVKSTIHNLPAPSGSTNIAHGIAVGRQLLDGTGKRANAVRVLVLLTDGIPNYYCTNSSAYTSGSSCSTGSSATSPTSCSPATTAMTHAWAQASAAAAADVTVYVIGLGDGVLDCVLQQIADNGGGIYYHAPTTAQLDEAFEAIAEQTHIALVR
jgi:hypothetical protein